VRDISSIVNRIHLQFGDVVTRKIAGGGLIALVIKVTSAALTYAMFVLLARVMPIAEFGSFSFGFNLATFLSFVAGFGLHIAITRWWPEYNVKNRPELARSAYRWSARITLQAGLFVVVIMLLAGSLIGEGAGIDRFTLWLASVLIIPLALSELLAGVFRANGQFVWALMPKDVIWRSIVCAVCGALIFSGRTLLEQEAILLVTASLAVPLIFQLLAFERSAMRGIDKLDPSPEDRKLWLRTAAPIWVSGMIYAATQYMDVVLVGLMLTPENVAIYFAATKTASLLLLMQVVSTLVSGPLISTGIHGNDIPALQKALRVSALITVIPSLIAFAAIAIAGDKLLDFFGDEFDSGYWALLTISFGYLVVALSGPVSTVLQLGGKESVYMRIMFTTYVVTIPVQLALIYSYGLIGAAVGSAVGMIIWNVRARKATLHHFGIDPTAVALIFSRSRAQ
jgi:O-antigen/teichoic acid export membrane protein